MPVLQHHAATASVYHWKIDLKGNHAFECKCHLAILLQLNTMLSRTCAPAVCDNDSPAQLYCHLYCRRARACTHSAKASTAVPFHHLPTK